MAYVTAPATCQACGRQLPVQQGKGRKRRYCDARCRDAARRARTRAQRDSARNVNDSLTSERRHDYLYIVPEGADPLAVRIGDAADRLIRELTGTGAGAGTGSGSPLDVVAAARELSAAAADSLQASVDRAREAGASWREIGDVLETTRQAAFQRFGRPVDPRTNKPMARQTLPGAEDKAIEILGCIIEGRWEDARRDFGEKMLEAVSANRIALAWAGTVARVGSYERMGEPLVYQANDATVVDIPLFFEAGDWTGQVAFDREGRVVGLFLRPAR